jgi:hypothetical protein
MPRFGRFLSLLLLAFVFTAQPAAPAHAGFFGLLSGQHSAEKRKAELIRKNARDGARRERVAVAYLRVRHPLSRVRTQRELVDERGRPIVDRASNETRRFDAAVIGRFSGRVNRLYEITSSTASKRAQEDKTSRILHSKRAYIVDPDDGELRRVHTGWIFPTRIFTVRTGF